MRINVTQATSGIGTGTSVETVGNITIYPNPVADGFQINGLAGKAMLMLTNVSGKTVMMKEIQGNEYIQARSLPKGVYIVRISTQSGTIDKKLIKK